jgi:two-component system response regulator YesN
VSKYKVILVEDEIPARMVFRQMIEARGDLFELAGEAEDGLDGLALAEAHRPHLIVTDITMPRMTGLEMLHELERKGLALPQTVILTCHQDFHYAQQAIQLKAASYLIKDDCLSDPELLVRTLEGLAEKVDLHDQNREKQRQLEQKVRSNEVEIEQNLFLDMLRNPAAEGRWLESLEAAGIPAEDAPFRFLLLELDRGSLRFSMDQLEELKLWQFAGVNVLKELLEGMGPNKVVALDKGRFIAFYVSERDGGLMPEKVADSFNAFLKMNCIVLQCLFEPGLAKQLGLVKKMAGSSYPFFYRSNETVTARMWEEANRFTSVDEQHSRFWMRVVRQALLEPHAGEAALESERDSFLRQAAEHRWDPEQIKSLYLRAFLDISHFKPEAGAGTDLEAELRSRLAHCQTFLAVHNATFMQFHKLQQLHSDTKKIDASIARIVQRMHEDVGYPFRQEELAASINYSIPYFSSMFKKTTGESFIQYLTRLRIEKAKLLLLTTDQRTFEIADSVGMENYRSFNRLFKRETGMTPSDFRKRME